MTGWESQIEMWENQFVEGSPISMSLVGESYPTFVFNSIVCTDDIASDVQSKFGIALRKLMRGDSE
jgi:hypothetical protein